MTLIGVCFWKQFLVSGFFSFWVRINGYCVCFRSCLTLFNFQGPWCCAQGAWGVSLADSFAFGITIGCLMFWYSPQSLMGVVSCTLWEELMEKIPAAVAFGSCCCQMLFGHYLRSFSLLSNTLSYSRNTDTIRILLTPEATRKRL